MSKTRKVTLGSNIKSLGDYCFYGCKKLKNVKMRKNIKKSDTTFGKCQDIEFEYIN